MAKFGRDRMPHVGSERPDEAGLQLIADWITALDGDSRRVDEPQASSSIEQQLTQSLLAQRWARQLGRGELSTDERTMLIRAAVSLEPGALRDLFEGYLPVDGHEPKLGPRPRPASISSLTGDPERGKKLFWDKSSNCATCHKIGNEGVSLGPELTRIGQKRTRDELLDSLLNSSRTVDPAFAAYLLVTKDGRSISGLLVRRTPTEVVLRDAKNREVVIPSDELERLTVSRVSLMPDGLLAGFTAQQAADLVAYLVSLRE
jgi:putative heme-binding domain-containing protein